ncbi:EscU/YscU/HrcU family type III secretion system export apparatus switch protein [Lederbergia sp. NSJ-179]|uniref:EscU/YscU/HrcU family type III secretion system export apparatus switch protein n=1 Tax=Lederbergia sp. NSJ-179 TaxID=2931402 RepID=UPI001FCF871D|nr:EscU/YscU/HrcU family type III secretion system export apparatus switch protein [Lederbergia sp. NSJ-179]MCJ7839625.1 EscU/YscU/HrcU family type III secretion system export apparatus switch protein [Lederbergia sp. NSJ-179]
MKDQKQENQKRKEAIALGYQRDQHEAPVVLAKGKGMIAENILEKAKIEQIPVQQDPALLELLGQLHINETIPEELYQAVAEVFAFVYRLDRQKSHS